MAESPTPPTPLSMQLARGYMGIVGAPWNLKYAQLPREDRYFLQFYVLWVQCQVGLFLYHQHSYPYAFRHNPNRLRFWMRALNPITPLFGGPKITKRPVSLNLFANMVALGWGLFLVGPVIWCGRHWVDNHPQSELLAEYLYTGPWVTGCLIVPGRLNRKKLNAKRQELYEDFLRLGQPVPEEYLPTTMWDQGLLEYRNAFKLATRKVIEERKENSGGEFNPEISVVEGKPVGPRKVRNGDKK